LVVWGLVLALTAAGATLRFHDLGRQSLWHDEIIQVRISRGSLGAILGGVWENENDMPIDHCLQYMVLALRTESEFWIRFHAALFGTLTLPAAFLLARAVLGPTVGLATMALLVFSPFHLHYSQEGRPFALLVLVTTLSTWALWQFTRGGPKSWRWGGLYAATSLIAVWVHLTAAVVIAIQQVWVVALWLVAWLRREPAAGRMLRRTLTSVAVAALCALSLLPVLGRLSGADGRAPGHPFTPLSADLLLTYLNGFAFALDENEQWFDAGLWAFPLLVLGVVWAGMRRPSGAWLIALLWLGTTGGVLFLCWQREHWFSMRYALVGLVPFLALEALGIAALIEVITISLARSPARRAVVAGTLLLAALLIGGGIAGPFLWAHPFEKRDWRGGARWIVDNVGLEGRVLTSDRSRKRLNYYLGRLGWLGVLDEVDRDELMDVDYTEHEGKFFLIRSGSRREPLRRRLWGHPHVARPQRLDILFLGDPRPWFESDPRRVAEAAAAFAEAGQHLDLGAEPFMALGHGWGWAEKRDGTSIRWAADTTPELLIPLVEPRDFHLHFRANTHSWDGAPPQSTMIRVNGVEVAQGVITPGWFVYGAPCPSSLWRPGVNVIEFVLDHVASPQETSGKTDPRPLGIAVDWLALAEGLDTPQTVDHDWGHSGLQP
jgi:hypothetical protein